MRSGQQNLPRRAKVLTTLSSCSPRSRHPPKRHLNGGDTPPRVAPSSSSSSSFSLLSSSSSSPTKQVVPKRTGVFQRSLLQRSPHHHRRRPHHHHHCHHHLLLHQGEEVAVRRRVAKPLKPAGRLLSLIAYSVVGIVCLMSLLDATASSASVIPTSDWNAQPLFIRAARSAALSNGGDAVRPRRRGLMRMCPPGGETFTSAWQMACGMRKRRKRDATAFEGSNGKLIIPTVGLQSSAHRSPMGANSVARPATFLDESYPITNNKHNQQYYAYSSESDDGGGGSTNVAGALLPPRLAGAAMDYLPYGGTVNSGEEADVPAKLVLPPALPASLSAAINAEAELRLLSSDPALPRGNTAAGGSLVIDTVEMPDVDRIPLAGQHRGTGEASTAASTHHHHYRAPSITEMMTVCCAYGCSLRDLLPYCSPFGDWDDY